MSNQIAMTITFEDHGQGAKQWKVDANGNVLASLPQESDIWAGVHIHKPVELGEKVCFTEGVNGKREIESRYKVAGITVH